MTRARSIAVTLLVLTAVADASAVPRLLTTDTDRPPVILPLIVAACAMTAFAAAVGLRQRRDWAPTLGLGSRGVEVLATAPIYFTSVAIGPKIAATVVIVLSLIAMVQLIAVRAEEPVAARSRG